MGALDAHEAVVARGSCCTRRRQAKAVRKAMKTTYTRVLHADWLLHFDLFRCFCPRP